MVNLSKLLSDCEPVGRSSTSLKLAIQLVDCATGEVLYEHYSRCPFFHGSRRGETLIVNAFNSFYRGLSQDRELTLRLTCRNLKFEDFE